MCGAGGGGWGAPLGVAGEGAAGAGFADGFGRLERASRARPVPGLAPTPAGKSSSAASQPHPKGRHELISKISVPSSRRSLFRGSFAAHLVIQPLDLLDIILGFPVGRHTFVLADRA